MLLYVSRMFEVFHVMNQKFSLFRNEQLMLHNTNTLTEVLLKIRKNSIPIKAMCLVMLKS